MILQCVLDNTYFQSKPCMYVFMYVRTYVCMYVCTYVRTYVCMYNVYIYIYVIIPSLVIEKSQTNGIKNIY